jgi:hypothetical protein
MKRFSLSRDKYLGVGDKRHVKINYKINSSTRDNKHVRQLEEISCRLAEMKKRILEDRETFPGYFVCCMLLNNHGLHKS